MIVPNWHNGPEYTFCGYTYEYDIMDDGDCRKIWHEINRLGWDQFGSPLFIPFVKNNLILVILTLEVNYRHEKNAVRLLK